MRGGEVPSCDVGARIGYAYRTTALGAQRVRRPPLSLTLLATHYVLRGNLPSQRRGAKARGGSAARWAMRTPA